MKRFLLIISLFFTTTLLFAVNCGNLGITITNASSHNCVLAHTSFLYGGTVFEGHVPLAIASGETSPTFFLQQDNSGAAIWLDYRCENKVVAFYSGQNYCGVNSWLPGIESRPYLGNDLSLEHHEVSASYWGGRPGQVIWKFF